MADNDPRNTGGAGDPRDPERTAAHRLGPPMRPMRPGSAPGANRADAGYVDRVTDDGAPVDVAAVRRDDDLIEALAAGGAVSTADDTEFALASLLADWRDEIVTTPVPAGPSLDEAAAAAESGRRQGGGRGGDRGPSTDGVTPLADAPGRKRARRFTVIAGSAAAALAILGGGTVVVNSATPGDGALWSVKEVVFSDAASQTLATSQAKEQLAIADREISASNPSAAETALVSARQEAAKVKNARDRAKLQERIRALEAQAELPIGSTDLPPSHTQDPTTRPTSPDPTTVSPPPQTTVDPTIMLKPTTSKPKPTSTTKPKPTEPSDDPTTTTTTKPKPTTTTTTTKPRPTFTVQRPGQLPGE
ncbi:anti-sigma-D factor RsdA [Tsukamurella sp. 1534]|uniref:anti-sigma-D factor RsdA n=1 Tax=Tsukamurella sp. 1534 TaxID=1151061 RepID=UPI0003014736|nr:anti-sigma-D factor RsdA [Tsukamurella sp. 1534]